MVQPASILNTRAQSTDTIYHPDGTPLIKLAIGNKAIAGLTPHAGWQGSASHADGDTFVAADGVSVAAGVDSGTGDVVKFLVDALGRLLIGQLADDSALAGGDYVFPMAGRADETATDSVDENDIGLIRITLDRKQIITPYVHGAAGGTTPYKLISANTTNGTNVKASAGKIHQIIVNNLNAAVRYLKLYDKASAPTVGSDTPKMTIALPAASSQIINFGDLGLQFASGIGFSLNTGLADADTGAVAANEHVVNLAYA